MDRQAWKHHKDSQDVYRRAGGRRRYNAARRQRANQRLVELARALAHAGDLEGALGRGHLSLSRYFMEAMAMALGVHRSTVWRDMQRLRRWSSYSSRYTGATDMIVIRLTGLTQVAYKLGRAEPDEEDDPSDLLGGER